MSRYFWNFKLAWYTEVCAHPIRLSNFLPHAQLLKMLIMATAQLPSPKKSQSAAGHSRAEAESDSTSQFGCPMCGLIGLTPDFLRAIHMPSCSMDSSKSVDESPCPQYSDVATFNAFINCQGNKYFSDNYGVCTQCQCILHPKPQFGLSTCWHHNCDVFPHHCMSLGPVFPFQRKWLLFCLTHWALCSQRAPKI